MNAIKISTLATLLMVFPGLAENAGAAPVPAIGTLKAIESAAPKDTLVKRAHGCHRNWVKGWSQQFGRRLTHRHVRPLCQPVRPQRYRGPGRPDGWQNRGCFKIGPVWYCP